MGQHGRPAELSDGAGSAPRVSIVVVGRNDDYEGNFVDRMGTSVRTALHLLEERAVSYELVVVDWNPPPGRPSLAEALSWPRIPLRSGVVRVIRVPADIHGGFPNADRIPLFEYIGKNVGVRRARGTHVLVTNPDIILSRGLIGVMTSGRLRRTAYYRVPRYDVRGGVPPAATPDQVLTYCRRHILRVNGHWYSGPWTPRARVNPVPRIAQAYGILWELGRERAARLNGEGRLTRFKTYRRLAAVAEMARETVRDRTLIYPFSNASGDFLLMHRDVWSALRGFPELASHSFLDTYMVYMAHFAGCRLRVFRGRDVFLYHQEHSRAAARARPWTDLVRCQQECLQMALDGRPLITNDPQWGLGPVALPEDVIAP